MLTKRHFSSYGPVDKEINYFVPRTELVNRAIQQLVGENPEKGGHYFTVWAPRQSGKTWIFWQVLYRLQAENNFTVCCMSAGLLRDIEDDERNFFVFKRLFETELKRTFPELNDWDDFKIILTKEYFEKPLIWIIDEFDVLKENLLAKLVNIFREIYLDRNKVFGDKQYNLQGVALIGVRSVLGIDNKKGSPFNIQKSIHIPNLTFDEVKQMYDDYQKEWDQKIEPEIVEKLFYETQGQPGLVSWFGELMVEKYNKDYPKTIDMKNWREVFVMARDGEPNNTIMNLISKANSPEFKNVLLDLFRTDEKTMFSFDDPLFNQLYMNGVITYEKSDQDTGDFGLYAKFSCPFVQKRLFNRFSRELYPNFGKIIKPFEDIDHIYNGKDLNIKNLLRRFEQYLHENKSWLLKDAPRRKSDLRICEASFHFIIHGWLSRFLNEIASVIPEFPTGNGKVDLIIKTKTQNFGLELKSFSTTYVLQNGAKRAAEYAKQLKMKEFYLVVFVDSIDDDNRAKLEKEHFDEETGVTIFPVLLKTGE